MATCILRSPDETRALGEQWGRTAGAGWLIGLTGDLGAGKTQLVKGLARGLGIDAAVRSPSFALVHQYHSGRLRLVHLDFYRLDSAEQIRRAGLDDFLARPEGVTVVEWIERWTGEDGTVRVPNVECRTAGAAAQVRTGESRLPGRPPVLAPGLPYRHVWLQWLSETERRITYEDAGA